MAVVSGVALNPAWALTVDERSVVRWLLAILWTLTGIRALQTLDRGMTAEPVAARRVAAHVVVAAGGVLLGLIVLAVLGISPSGLLIGGAATGVVLGLAAQSSLGNLFGGLMLIFLRPYLPGDHIRLRSASFAGGEYGGVVRDLNLFYTVLDDGSRRVVVPNASAVVAAVVVSQGPRRQINLSVPAGSDVERAQASLRSAVPGAELTVTRWSPAGIDATLDLPADAPWAPVERWLGSLAPPAAGSAARRLEDASTAAPPKTT